MPIKRPPGLGFRELFWLRIIGATDSPISVRQAQSLFNQFVEEFAVPPGRTLELKSNRQRDEIIKRLRATRMISEKEEMIVNKTRYNDLYNRIGNDWKEWPQFIPYDDSGDLQFEKME